MLEIHVQCTYSAAVSSNVGVSVVATVQCRDLPRKFRQDRIFGRNQFPSDSKLESSRTGNSITCFVFQMVC